MTHTKRNPAARLLCLLLAVVMLGGLFAVSAQAADWTNVKHYQYYSCIGDSIAAGYGPYADWIRGFETVPEAYHSLVANATGAEVQSLSHVGMRTVEARWLLDDEYAASQEALSYNAMRFNGMMNYVDWMAGRTSPYDPKPEILNDAMYNELKDYYGAGGLSRFYRSNVAKSDLITLALGLNDIFLYAMKMTAARLDDPNMNLITEVATFVAFMNSGYNGFMQNWEPLIKAIKRINPDATLVVVGLYNPFTKVKLTNASWAAVGRIADGMVQGVNNYLSQQADALGYKYADVTQTEICDTVPFTDPTFFDRIVCDCHPTEAGHIYMMQQILAQLPERSPYDPAPVAFPFWDVVGNDWFYPDVYYCWRHGLMAGVGNGMFQPNGTTTRAQFATTLYRMANSPDVSGMSCPFTDLQPGSWYEKAVIWGYNAGVISGTSGTTFSPDANVTREQMVSMLFRYSGAAAPAGSLNQFSDAWSVSQFAVPAMIWAVQNKIISGMGDGTLNPQGEASRSQLAKILRMYTTM